MEYVSSSVLNARLTPSVGTGIAVLVEFTRCAESCDRNIWHLGAENNKGNCK